MKKTSCHLLAVLLLAVVCSCGLPALAMGQATDAPADPPTSQGLADETVQDKVADQVREIGDTLNQSQTARDFSAGILDPIYQAAEYIAFPAFYWLAFMLMAAGVIGFAGQLVLTKFLLLFRGSLNLREILSDALGLVISVVGLVLTTQAATENSDFTSSPVMVLSAAGVGVVLGLLVFVWGQRQEFDAARGAEAKHRKSETDQRRVKM